MAKNSSEASPTLSTEIRPYFDAAAQQRLLVKRCTECGKHHHYPRAMCPFCASERTEWTESSGRGVIYSFAVAKGVDGGAHVLAYVTLDGCGVTMLTNIVADDASRLRVGGEVQAIFRPGIDGLVVPMFAPAEA